MVSRRMTIVLPKEDKLWLEEYCQAQKVSVDEAVGLAILILRRVSEKDIYYSLVEKTRGLWKAGDGLEYQMSIRSQ